MKRKYDKFLLAYGVAKRAKEITEDDIHYLEEADRVVNSLEDMDLITLLYRVK